MSEVTAQPAAQVTTQAAEGQTEAKAPSQETASAIQPANPQAQAEQPKAPETKTEAPADPAVESKEEPKAEEAPKTEEKKEQPELALTLPEGVQAAPGYLDSVASYAKTHGLNQAQAQALVQRDAQIAQARLAEQEKFINERRKEWQAQSLADKEIGGPELARNAENAKRIAAKALSPDFMKLLDESGFIDHPEVVKHFVRLGKEGGEDRMIHASAHGSSVMSAEERLYGKQGSA